MPITVDLLMNNELFVNNYTPINEFIHNAVKGGKNIWRGSNLFNNFTLTIQEQVTNILRLANNFNEHFLNMIKPIQNEKD